MKILSLIACTALFTNISFSQDQSFNMENKAPLIFNPALTGINNFGIVSVFHQNYMPALSGSYNTSIISYQTPIAKRHGGLGIYYMNQNALYKIDNFGISYSFQAKISEKIALSAGVSSELLHNRFKTEPIIGDVYPFNIEPYQINTNLGILLYSENAFFGGSIRNISTTAPIQLMSNAGYKFTLLKEKLFYLTPTITYTYQDQYQNVTLKLNSSYKWINLSVGYREGDSFLFAGGVDIKNININYSYNITTSKLTNAVGGVHEFSIRYKLKNKKNLSSNELNAYNFNIF